MNENVLIMKINRLREMGKSREEIALELGMKLGSLKHFLSKHREHFPIKERKSGALTGYGEKLKPWWKFSQPNRNKLYIYFGQERTPRFKFERQGVGTNWVGHGVYAMSKNRIFKWINTQTATRE